MRFGPAGAELTAKRCFRPATRISKNSSRFVEEIQRNFKRSSRNSDLRLLQHAHVERELRQLAVHVIVGQLQVQRIRGAATLPGAQRVPQYTPPNKTERRAPVTPAHIAGEMRRRRQVAAVTRGSRWYGSSCCHSVAVVLRKSSW